MTNKTETAQDGTPAPSRESQQLAALRNPLAWLLRGREGIRVETLLAKVALLVYQGFVPLPGDAEGQTEVPKSKNEEEWRRTKEIIAGVLERLIREGLCEVIDPGGEKKVRRRRGVDAEWDRLSDGMQKDYDALARSAKERLDAGEEPDLDALLESSLDGRWGEAARKLMLNDAESEIDRLRRDRLTSTGAGPGATSPSPEPDGDTLDAVLCCSGSGKYLTEDDGRGGGVWRKSTPAAAGGKGGPAPDTRAAARAPATPTTTTSGAPGGTTPGAVGLESRGTPRPSVASDSPANTTLRNRTMKTKTKAAQPAAPAPDVATGTSGATGPAPADTAAGTKAEPPND